MLQPLCDAFRATSLGRIHARGWEHGGVLHLSGCVQQYPSVCFARTLAVAAFMLSVAVFAEARLVTQQYVAVAARSWQLPLYVRVEEKDSSATFKGWRYCCTGTGVVAPNSRRWLTERKRKTEKVNELHTNELWSSRADTGNTRSGGWRPETL